MTARRIRSVIAVLALVANAALAAPVSQARLDNATAEPQNWLSYSGNHNSQRFSSLTQIDQSNVTNLKLSWLVQNKIFGVWEATPLVADGVMYVSERPNGAMAIDAETGRLFWSYQWKVDPAAKVCCGSNNRGLALAGDTVLMGTLDAHLVALDSRTGKPLWSVAVADAASGYSITMAPMVVKGRILVGVGGGEYGIRGFVAAYDPATGRELWRFNTVPSPGEPGHETWVGDTWKTGGAPVWNTGSYDPALNTVYFGTGNPGPDWNPAQRHGDNLYSDCVIALDPDTGTLKWHFQFTPNDAYDFDATQVPVLADMPWKGKAAKLLLLANRNGFFYVLDRTTGKFISGTPFAKLNWAKGLDAKGRPIPAPLGVGDVVFPGNQGATNWYPPAFSPRTGLFYFSVWENYASRYRREDQVYSAGRSFTGGGVNGVAPAPGAPTIGIGRPDRIDYWTDEVGSGATVAWNPITGERAWSFAQHDVTDAGMLVTASDIVFTGGREGYFYAFDARNGALLWKAALGGPIVMGPITYQVKGKQHVAVIAGNVLTSFALPDCTGGKACT